MEKFHSLSCQAGQQISRNEVSVDLKDAGQQWIHLIPGGEIVGRDGRTWRMMDAHAVVAATNAHDIDIPVDYEHQTERAPKNGQPAPAAGWIKELAVRESGIWGRVEWTAKARQMIQNREYRYISPVFSYEKHSRDVLELLSAGLTNIPNLELVALNRKEERNPEQFTKELQSSLGLAEDADQKEILQKVASIQVATAINNGSVEPDPEKYVPVEQVKRMLTGFNVERQTQSEETISTKVDKSIQEGLFPPALRSWATALCRHSPGSFDEFTGSIVPMALTQRSGLEGRDPDIAMNSRGTALEQEVAEALGVDLNSMLAKRD